MNKKEFAFKYDQLNIRILAALNAISAGMLLNDSVAAKHFADSLSKDVKELADLIGVYNDG